MELLKVYKILPAPDFCHFSAIPGIAAKYETQNKWNIDQTLNLARNLSVTISTEEFENYQRLQMIYMFYARHKVLPGKITDTPDPPAHLVSYPNVSIDKLTIHDMPYIDIRGTFAWKDYDGLEHELVKDKTTAPQHTVDSVKGRKVEENQVLKYLFDTEFLSQATVRTKFMTNQTNWNHRLKISWKAEAKKPSSRVFYMANDPDRRLLSEIEKNIADYVEHKPGSSQGKSERELLMKMQNIGTREEAGYTAIKVSFDIAAWSPRQSFEFKMNGLRKWEEAFNVPSILLAADVFNRREVYVDKFGHKDSYTLKGVDMEGMSGRMNTDLHVDLMGYCVFKLREAKVIDKGGLFECLIDDGVLNLLVPNNGFQNRANAIMRIIEWIYAAFSHEISWDKTFVSQHLFQYLNEVFLEDHRITPGVKSFLRIGKLQAVPIENLMDELMAHAATARGAIKSGTDHNVAYLAYVIEYYFTLKRWSGWKLWGDRVETLALRCHLPFNLGGFSINSVFSLSTNETFATFEACVANCRMIMMSFPALAPFFKVVFNRPPVPMDPTTILQTPMSFRFDITSLSNRKFPNAVRSIILKDSVNPLVRAVSERIQEFDTSVYAQILANNRVIHEVVRQLLADMDPEAVLKKIIGKLQNSSTAAYILGARKVLALRMVYRLVARKVILEVLY